MLDITFAVGAIDGLDIFTKGLDQRLVNVIKIFTTAVCNIECLAGRLVGSEACFQIGFDDVFDISKVAALLAISVDRRTLVIQEHLDELRDHGGVGPVRVLPASEHVEVAQAHGPQAVVARVLFRPFLVGPLGQGVGAEERAFDAFLLGKMRLVAVDRTGGCVHEGLDAGAARGFQHV